MRKRNSPSDSTEYRAWSGMKDRCYNKNTKVYHNYGGRGITVCDRWIHSFGNFLEDMGRKPSCELSLDRFPNGNGNYEPSNCRWGTSKDQNNNKRSNLLISFNKQTKTLGEWCESLCLNYDRIYQRIHKDGWEAEKALSTPFKSNKKFITFNNKTQSITEWAKEIGIKPKILMQRFHKLNMSVDIALTMPVEIYNRKLKTA